MDLFWLLAIRSLLLPVWGRKYLQQRSPSSGKHDLQFRLGWKSWKQSAELIAVTQRPPTRNQNAPNFLHLNYWLVSTNCCLQIIAEDLFLLATLVYLTFLPFHKMFVPEGPWKSNHNMLQIFCHLWDSLSRLQFLSLIQKRDFIFPSLIQHSLKIENLQHFPALHQPTDLPTVPSRVTQRFLPQSP